MPGFFLSRDYENTEYSKGNRKAQQQRRRGTSRREPGSRVLMSDSSERESELVTRDRFPVATHTTLVPHASRGGFLLYGEYWNRTEDARSRTTVRASEWRLME
jgi:hypothetical protein